MLLSFKSRLSGSFQLPLLLMVLFVCAPAAFGQAQSNAVDIQGTVKDATGAVVANATVTARNPGTNFSRTATSNDEGFYRIINVPPGDYEITVEASNFKKAVLPRVTVTIGQAAVVDISLEPGQITESVTISDATSEIVETSTHNAHDCMRERVGLKAQNYRISVEQTIGCGKAVVSLPRTRKDAKKRLGSPSSRL